MEETVENVTEVASTPTKKPKKKKSLARKITEWVLFGLFGVLFTFILAGNINGEIHKKENYGQSIRFGVGSFVVLTNSMEPEIPVDSAIITYKEEMTDVKHQFDNGHTVDLTFVDIASQYVPYSFVPDTEIFKTGTRTTPTNQVMTHRLREVHVDESIPYGKGRFIFVVSGINDQGELSKKGQYQVFTEKEYLGTVKVTNVFLGKVFKFIVSAWGLIILLLIPAAYLIVVSSIDIFKTLKASEESEASSDNPSGGKLDSVKGDDRERLKKELLDEMIKAKKEEKKDE